MNYLHLACISYDNYPYYLVYAKSDAYYSYKILLKFQDNINRKSFSIKVNASSCSITQNIQNS